LYDLKIDPHETRNLAADPVHAVKLRKLRDALYEWMVLSRDLGLIPEPILEENGRQTDRVLAIRATDKETRVRMEFQSENKAEVHCLLIENENQSRPAGEFKIRRCIPLFDTLMH
jgi:hypothetical protein